MITKNAKSGITRYGGISVKQTVMKIGTSIYMSLSTHLPSSFDSFLQVDFFLAHNPTKLLSTNMIFQTNLLVLIGLFAGIRATPAPGPNPIAEAALETINVRASLLSDPCTPGTYACDETGYNIVSLFSFIT